jgi:uncharacterized repeat protein (TIGR01451 family)
MRRPGTRYMGSLAAAVVLAGGLLSPVALAANTPPVADDQAQDVRGDAATTLDLSASDTEGDPLTFTIVSPPAHGALGDCTSGSCDYTPAANYSGLDAFTWKANDGPADSNVATFSLTVAAPASQPIVSDGPLSRVEISTDLACAIDHTSDAASEFFGDHACATLVAVGGTLYRPADLPSGGSAAPFTPFTPVSQSVVQGSGTDADPRRIVTVVELGATGLRLTETDSYVIGQETYRTDVSITNVGGSRQSIVLYRAGDCYLQNSDVGYGAYDAASGAVSCVSGVDDGTGAIVPGPRIEQWYPLSPGSSGYEAGYDEVWARIGAQQPFAGGCQCADLIDNGAGLSWSLTVPAGGSVSASQLTGFSPLGMVPVVLGQAVANASVAPGARQVFTLTLTNPNKVPATVTSITNTLPAGFTFVPGSTTGLTTTDPTVAAQAASWTGSFVIAPGSSVTLTFAATAPTTAGTYPNAAAATVVAPFVVVPGGPGATTTVGGPAPAAGSASSPPLAYVLPGPFDLSYAPQDVARSVGLTFLLMLLIAAPTPLFNSTLEHNLEDIRHMLRLDRLPRSRLTRRLTHGWPGLLLYLGLAALLYALKDLAVPGPDAIPILAGGLVGLALINAALALPRDRYVWRRFRRHGTIEVAQWTLAIAAVCVVVTRLTAIQPGYIYGVIAGVAFTVPLSRDDEGEMAFRAAFALLVLAVGAWFLRVPFQPPPGQPATGAGLFADTVLVAAFVAGVEGLVFGLIPIRFMLGHPLSGWRPLRWVTLWAIGLVLFAHVILYPVSDYEPNPSAVGIWTVVITVLVYGAVAVAFWWYFRERARRRERASEPPAELG